MTNMTEAEFEDWKRYAGSALSGMAAFTNEKYTEGLPADTCTLWAADMADAMIEEQRKRMSKEVSDE